MQQRRGSENPYQKCKKCNGTADKTNKCINTRVGHSDQVKNFDNKVEFIVVVVAAAATD